MGGFFKDVLDGKVRDVRKWIENGENVNQIDQYGNTALHIAAEKGFRGVCKNSKAFCPRKKSLSQKTMGLI